MPLTIYAGTNPAVCAAKFAAILRANGSVFEADTVVIQSRVMARWLNLELARCNGISAHVDFLFPRQVVDLLLGAQANELPDASVWCWALFDALVECSESKVVAYLQGDDSGLKRWSLAVRLADLFDQYQMYRSASVKTDAFWGAEPWQRALFESICCPSRAALIESFILKPPEALPFKRLFIFGVSYLPPLLLELLKVVSNGAEIHFFLIAPVSSAMESRLTAQWGRESRVFEQQLFALADKVIDLSAPSNPTTLLQGLQQLLSGGEPVRCAVDDTLSVVSCHSPRREVEVLHTELLRIFEDNPSLQPEEVLITAPDPDVYAAHLQAVFLHGGDHPLPLHRLNGATNEASVGCLLMEICALTKQRLSSVDLMGLCGNRLIQDKFALEVDDIGVIHELLSESRFCWGLSGADKAARFGLPATEAHSLTQSVGRMVLGIALDDDSDVFSGAVLPLNGMTGWRSEAGAKLWALADALEQTFADVDSFDSLERTEKIGVFRRVLDRFVVDDPETASELAQVDSVLSRLLGRMSVSASFAVVCDALSGELSECKQSSMAMLGGGISVCRLNDVATVPFKVVAVLGLNEGAFPKTDSLLSFNLMATECLPGDRNRTASDLAIFLRRIQTTQSHLLLSYCGGSMHRASSYPPAVPLAELMDVVKAELSPLFKPVEHPMQSFSPRYFSASTGLVSYHEQDRLIAAQLQSGCAAEVLRFRSPVAEEREELLELSPQQLSAFLMDASKFFIQQVLNVRLPGEEESLPSVEPFGADALSLYGVRQAVVEGLLGGMEEESVRHRVLADGVLPDGAVGSDCLDGEVLPVCRLLYSELQNEPPPADELLFVDLTLAGGMIRGSVGRCCGDHLVLWRPGKLTPKYLLTYWTQHLLAMCCGVEAPTRLYGIDGGRLQKWVFTVIAPSDAQAGLQRLFGLYRSGLRHPVPLFPKSAWAYVESADSGKGEAAWNDNYQFAGEQADPFNQLIYKGALPEGWDRVATEAFEQLTDHLGDADEAL